MVVDDLTLTVSDMEKEPEKWARFELYRGVPIGMPYTKPLHAKILSTLTYFLVDWIRNKNGKGEVYGGEAGLKLSEDTRYCFELGWSATSLPEEEIPQKALDLMIAITSEGNEIDHVMQKVEDYLQNGAKQVWLVSPARKTIQVFYPDNTSKIYTLKETLTGGELLKGFELPLINLFGKKEK